MDWWLCYLSENRPTFLICRSFTFTLICTPEIQNPCVVPERSTAEAPCDERRDEGGGLVSVLALTLGLHLCRADPLQGGTDASPPSSPLLSWSGTGAKLEPAVPCPPPEQQQQQQQFQWSGTERQPPPWTDELAEMSRHIYTRHGIGEGLQKPVFQVGKRKEKKKSPSCYIEYNVRADFKKIKIFYSNYTILYTHERTIITQHWK